MWFFDFGEVQEDGDVPLCALQFKVRFYGVIGAIYAELLHDELLQGDLNGFADDRVIDGLGELGGFGRAKELELRIDRFHFLASDAGLLSLICAQSSKHSLPQKWNSRIAAGSKMPDVLSGIQPRIITCGCAISFLQKSHLAIIIPRLSRFPP